MDKKEKKYHYYNFEGLELDIPLKWFDLQDRYIEDYSDFMDEPQKYTPLGHPVIFTYRDPCKEFEDKITDCVDCPCFKKADVPHHTLIGICTHESMKQKNKESEVLTK